MKTLLLKQIVKENMWQKKKKRPIKQLNKTNFFLSYDKSMYKGYFHFQLFWLNRIKKICLKEYMEINTFEPRKHL